MITSSSSSNCSSSEPGNGQKVRPMTQESRYHGLQPCQLSFPYHKQNDVQGIDPQWHLSSHVHYMVPTPDTNLQSRREENSNQHNETFMTIKPTQNIDNTTYTSSMNQYPKY